MKIIALAFGLLVLAGCASNPLPAEVQNNFSVSEVSVTIAPDAQKSLSRDVDHEKFAAIIKRQVKSSLGDLEGETPVNITMNVFQYSLPQAGAAFVPLAGAFGGINPEAFAMVQITHADTGALIGEEFESGAIYSSARSTFVGSGAVTAQEEQMSQIAWEFAANFRTRLTTQ